MNNNNDTQPRPHWYVVACGDQDGHYLAFGVPQDTCDICGQTDCRLPYDDTDTEM